MYQPALSRRPIGIEELEDRTLLTSMISIDDVSILEGDSGNTTFNVLVRRMGAQPGDLNEIASVDFSTQDSTATLGDSDYVAKSGTLTFSADASATVQYSYIQIHINGDLLIEENETFQIRLTNPALNTSIVKDISNIEILNDDIQEYVATQSVIPPAPVSVNDRFGQKVAVDGDYMVVGAAGSDLVEVDSGAAYVYFRDHHGTSDESDDTWEYHSTLTASDASSGDHFGTSFAIDGNTIVIGADGVDNDGASSGAAYIYQLSGAVWSFDQKIIASDRTDNANFGNDVAIENNTIVVGAANHDLPDKTDAGAAFIFTRTAFAWSEAQELTLAYGNKNDHFGYSVAIHNNEVFVSAPDNTPLINGSQSGAVYAFKISSDSWQLEQSLTPNNGIDDQKFGWDLAVDGNRLGIISTGDSGSSLSLPEVDFYTKINGEWRYRGNTFLSATPDYLLNSYSIDISETTLVVGAYDATKPPSSAGTVTIYQLNNDTWIKSQVYTESNSSERDSFGAAVAIAGTQIIVGAPASDISVVNSGEIHILGHFLPGFTISGVTQLEGDNGTTEFQFTIERKGNFAGDLNSESSIYFSTQDGTATTAGGDYQAQSGTLTFSANPTAISQTQTVSVTVNTDTIYEGLESFYVNLSDPSDGFTLLQPHAEGTIEEDDYAIVSTTSSSITVNESDGSASITVTLDRVFTENVVVPISYLEAPADVGSDFAYPPQSVTIPAGQLSTTFSIDIYEDNIVERDEQFFIYLQSSENSRTSVSTLRVIVKILDNDQATLSISDAVISENQDFVTLRAELSAPDEVAFTVDFTTQNNTATSPDDYQATSGTIHFNGDSQFSEPFTIPIINSAEVESTESFFVNLDNIQILRFDRAGAITFSDSQSEVTIIDDDQYLLTIDDQTVNEADGSVTLTISLDHALPAAMSVDYNTFNQLAVADSDFQTTAGTLTFNPGDLTKTVTVPIIDDSSAEGLEAFFVRLGNIQANGSNVSFIQNEAKVTITDDDQAHLSITDLTVNENAGTAAITVSLNTIVNDYLSVNFDLESSTASTSDYGYLPLNLPSSNQIRFLPGEVTKTFSVSIFEDNLVEDDETFTVRISSINLQFGADVVVLDDQAEITILDNDQSSISINDINVDEGTETAVLTVSLTNPVDRIISVDYSTSDQSSIHPDDYFMTSGRLTFSPGEQSQSITIDIVDSELVEIDEKFLLSLSNLQSNGADVILGDDQAEVTIHDNDQASLIINDLTVNEDEGAAVLTVSLDHAVDTAISVDYQTADQSAIEMDDYSAQSGTLTFSAGELTRTITIPLIDSDLLEFDEFFVVNLNNFQPQGRNVILADDQSIVSILDDDNASADMNLRLVTTPTVTQPNGTSAGLPDSQPWVPEWSAWWVEIWVTTSNQTGQGVASVNLDLSYNTAATSATGIEFGSSFTQNPASTIADQSGQITGLHAETTATDLGIDEQLLFARIQFEPLAQDQVPLDYDQKSIGPVTPDIQVDTLQVKLAGDVSAETASGASATTSIYANPYDLNDDDAITYRDLILFASVYNSTPSESDSDYAWFADLNQDNRVNFRDLILLATNYNKTKLNQQTVSYPANYPDAWNQLLVADTLTTPLFDSEPLTLSVADAAYSSVVDQVSGSLTREQNHILETTEVRVVDLQGDTLGRAAGGTIYIDVNAAGYGWYVDVSPALSSDFESDSDLTLIALPDSGADGRFDLQTVIFHELGHLLGFEHTGEGLMQESLAPGIRLLPDWELNLEFDQDLSIDDTDMFYLDVPDDTVLSPF